MDFWERLDLLVNEKSNRKTVAKECGFSVSAFSMWKKRKSYPQADQAVAIAQTLGTTVEYLVTGIESKSVFPPLFQTGKRADILKDLAAIDDEILDTIMIMIRSIAENCRKKHASRERPAG